MKKVSSADRGHLHHNLVDLGLSPGRAVIALHGIGILFAFSAYLTVAANSVFLALFTLTVSCGAVAVIKVVRSQVRGEDKHRA